MTSRTDREGNAACVRIRLLERRGAGRPGVARTIVPGEPYAVEVRNIGTAPLYVVLLAAADDNTARALAVRVVTVPARDQRVVRVPDTRGLGPGTSLVVVAFGERAVAVALVGNAGEGAVPVPAGGWLGMRAFPVEGRGPLPGLADVEYDDLLHYGLRDIARLKVRRPPRAAGAPRQGAGATPSRRKPPKSRKPTPQPARTAYGRLDAPAAVVAGTEFEVVVGLSDVPSPDVVGEPIQIPDPALVGPYPVRVVVTAPGCTLRDGEKWSHELRVTADGYPMVKLHLTSAAVGDIGARTIRALLSIDGVTVGMAVRSVAVVTAAGTTTAAPAGPDRGLFSYSLPPDYPVPDLTIRVTLDDTRGAGALLWDVDSPHAEVRRPTQAVTGSIGTEPRTFAMGIIRDVNAHEEEPDLSSIVRGYGRQIAKKLPVVVVDALRAVGALTAGSKRVPTVLLLTEEPFVPWELAVVDLGAGPAILGAQVAFGRWVLDSEAGTIPPAAVEVKRLAVVAGEYAGKDRLEEAEREARWLTETYGAVPVAANLAAVTKLLRGQPVAQALHFAVHGEYDPQGDANGLRLVDGKFVIPANVLGGELQKAMPFVYLNACQVGTGDVALGGYAGLAAAFLGAGASAVVAPLWSVDDTVAHNVSRRVYKTLLAARRTGAGEVLRRERERFAKQAEPRFATELAYQFFGHPQLMLSRKEASR